MKRMKNWWNKKSSWLVPLLAFIACFGVWFLAPLLSHWYITVFYNFNDIVSNTEIISESKTLLEKRALWGDSYGSINALISAFAFAGVIVSMYLQRKDLQLQRDSLGVQKDELIRNTNELASQRQEFETQNKTMSLQRFENTFFNMLNLQQEIVSNLKFRYREKGVSRDNNVANGREVFEALYVKMDVRVFRTNQSNKIDLEEAITGGIHNAIARNIDNYYLIQEKSILDHYFRNLYRIIKFVNDSVFLNNYEKYSYVAMVRATLSRYELTLLFYNGLQYYKFKDLIHEYSLLKNLDRNSLPDINHYSKYEETAYNPSIKGHNRPPIIEDIPKTHITSSKIK